MAEHSVWECPDARIRKAVLRASGWIDAGANRDVSALSVEMVDALAEDVLALSGEIVRGRRRLKNVAFVEYVMARLDP